MFRWQRAGLCPTYLGDKAPAGICGSGVVDALACLLELGLLDESGLLEEDPAPIAPPVVLTQRDARMAQLAKSAVCTGLRTLAQRAGLDWDNVEELAVAGGFGGPARSWLLTLTRWSCPPTLSLGRPIWRVCSSRRSEAVGCAEQSARCSAWG